MSIKILKSQSPAIILLLPIISGLLWLKTFFGGVSVDTSEYISQFILYKQLSGLIESYPLIFNITINVLILIQAFILVRINFNHILVEGRGLAPAIIFIILSSAMINLQAPRPVYFGTFFFILSLNQIFNTYKKSNSIKHIFLASLYLSLGSLFYIYLLPYLVLFWIGFYVTRSMNLRAFFVIISGILLPHIYAVAVYFFKGRTIDYLNSLKTVFISDYSIKILGIEYIVLFSVIGLLIMISFVYLIRTQYKKKIGARKFFLILVWNIVLTVIFYFSIPGVSIEILLLGFVPTTYLIANYYLNVERKWFGNLTFYLFLLSVVFIQLLEWLPDKYIIFR